MIRRVSGFIRFIHAQHLKRGLKIVGKGRLYGHRLFRKGVRKAYSMRMEGLAVKTFVQFMRENAFEHGERVDMVFSTSV